MAASWETKVYECNPAYGKFEGEDLLKSILCVDDVAALFTALDNGLCISTHAILKDEMLPVELYAIKYTALKCLEVLLDERPGSIAKIRDANKRNIVFHALRGGFTSVKLISALITADKKHNLRLFHFVDAKKNTALHVLLQENAPPTTIELVAMNYACLVVQTNISGLSPLHVACEVKWATRVFPTFLSLVCNVVSVDFSDKSGKTCLHQAALHGSTECVRSLLQCGAATSMCDSRGDLPIHIATRGRHLEIVMLLVSANPKCVYATNRRHETSLNIAVAMDNVELFNSLFEKHEEVVDAIDSHGFSLLHCAVVGGAVQIVPRLILERESIVETQDVNGRSPIVMAVYKDRSAVLTAILSTSSLAMQQLKRNEYSLTMCALRSGAHNALKVLIEYGVNLTKQLPNGDTVLHTYVMTEECREDTLCVLISHCEELVRIRNNAYLLPQDLVGTNTPCYHFLSELSSRPQETPCDDDDDIED